MKKIVILAIIALIGVVCFPSMKMWVIEYQVKRHLKQLDLSQYTPKNERMLGVELNYQAVNEYPKYKVTLSLNKPVPFDIPEIVKKQIEQKLEKDICNSLEQLTSRPVDEQQATANVMQRDQVTFIISIQDSKKDEIVQHQQQLSECENFSKLNNKPTP